MVLDEVEDGLRRGGGGGYRRSPDPGCKSYGVAAALLIFSDPRLAILLYSIVVDKSEDNDVHYWAFHILARNFLIGKTHISSIQSMVFFRGTPGGRRTEADLRPPRPKQLPQ